MRLKYTIRFSDADPIISFPSENVGYDSGREAIEAVFVVDKTRITVTPKSDKSINVVINSARESDVEGLGLSSIVERSTTFGFPTKSGIYWVRMYAWNSESLKYDVPDDEWQVIEIDPTAMPKYQVKMIDSDCSDDVRCIYEYVEIEKPR